MPTTNSGYCCPRDHSGDCSPCSEYSAADEEDSRCEKYPDFTPTLISKLNTTISKYGTSVYETDDRFERIYPEYTGDCSPCSVHSAQYNKEFRRKKYPKFRKSLDSRLNTIISYYGTSVYETNERFERVYPDFDGSTEQRAMLYSEIQKEKCLEEIENRKKYPRFYEVEEKRGEEKNAGDVEKLEKDVGMKGLNVSVGKEFVEKEIEREADEFEELAKEIEATRMADLAIGSSGEVDGCWTLDRSTFIPPTAPMALGTKMINHSAMENSSPRYIPDNGSALTLRLSRKLSMS